MTHCASSGRGRRASRRRISSGGPASDVVGGYFAAYERAFDLRVQRPVDVVAVSAQDNRPGGRLLVQAGAGAWSVRALVNATGPWDRPFWPHYPGQGSFRGRQLHTAQCPFDAEFGRHAVSLAEERVRPGLPPGSVVSVTGLPRTPEIEEARALGVLDRLPMFDRITPEGVAWNDGRRVAADVILWATGFRAALDHLAPLRLREPGGGIRLEGTRVVKDPRIHLIGYGGSASTIGANRAGRAAVREITDLLGIRRGRGSEPPADRIVPVAPAC